MTPSTACLRTSELLALALNEPASELLHDHLGECINCRARLLAMQAELSALRAAGAVAPPSTEVRAPGPEALSFDGPPAEDDRESDDATKQDEPQSNHRPRPNPRPHALGDDAADPASWEEAPIPSSIGKYVVVDRFARSGQAEVFRVVHPQFHRELVLKLALKPMSLDGRSDVLAEGRRLADLEHRNIVRVHDLDFHRGRPYLVMEYVRGRTLTQYAREEIVTPARAAALVAELAGAVVFAHRRGIVHQDIKPSNVLIDEAGRPRLIDFGLASQEDAWCGIGTRSEGGTFAFMSPEQARIEPDRIRPLCDIFALGAVLYFLLTGQAPFASATPDESWQRARVGECDRSALRKAGVLRRLERICLQAMAPEPGRRCQSAADLAEALRRHTEPRRITIAATTAFLLLIPGLCAGVALWGFLARTPPKPASSSQVNSSELPPGLEVSLVRINRFDVEHLARGAGDKYERIGNLGEHSFAVRAGDDVTIRAELSEPAYSYLIAFRPDGVEEVFLPKNPEIRPRMTASPCYPPESNPGLVYRLDEGTGLHAFALVVSRTPLPCYREWKEGQEAPPWKKGLSAAPDLIWWFDGRRLSPLTGVDPNGQRGQGETLRGGGNTIAELAVWLKAGPGVDAAAVKAFLVPPASKR